MGFLKKQSAGFFVILLTVIAGIVGAVLYYANCHTYYYSKYDMSITILALTAAAVALEVGYVILAQVFVRGIGKYVIDMLPVIPAVLFMAAFVQFLDSRLTSIGSIITFEKNAGNMADLKGAIMAMVVYLAGVVLATTATCLKVRKEK